MKIVFMGTPQIAAGILDSMMRAGFDVKAAVSQPDKPKGRGRGVSFTPVKECALKWGIEVFSPDRIRTPEAFGKLRSYDPDLIVVAAYGKILPAEILQLPRLGCINVHASLLPKYRGAAPIQWAVINGEKTSGVTIMQMDEGMDTGDILLQREIGLDPKETADSLYDKLTVLGGELLTEALHALERGELSAVKQDDSLSSTAPILKKEMGNVDWSMSAEAIERLVRGLNSWPGAYTFYKGRTLKIWGSSVCSANSGNHSPSGAAQPGTVVGTDKRTIFVQCGSGILGLEEVQLEGKKRMPVQAFLLGSPMRTGEMLRCER